MSHEASRGIKINNFEVSDYIARTHLEAFVLQHFFVLLS